VRQSRRQRFSRAAALITAALLSPALPAAGGDAAALLGRWHSLQNSEGGIGAIFEFRSGGIVDYSPGAVVEMPYRVEGDLLVLPPETQGGAEQKQKIEFLPDGRLRLSAAGTMSVNLARRGRAPAGDKSILGEWVGDRDMNGRVVETMLLFSADGKVLMVMPFLKSTGSYTVDGAKIHIGVENRWTADGTFKVEGNRLTLSIMDPKKGLRDWTYARY
jgi:hypothetical protein